MLMAAFEVIAIALFAISPMINGPISLVACGFGIQLVVGAASLYVWLQRRGVAARMSQDGCVTCGYCRIGISPQTLCPECGELHDPAIAERLRDVYY
jgi:hypothetical protein